MFIAGCIFGLLVGSLLGILYVCMLMNGTADDELATRVRPPEPLPKKKMIRFTDSQSRELFRIPDGGCICLISLCGYRQKCLCFYEGEDHVRINGKLWHMQAFARDMEARQIAYMAAD